MNKLILITNDDGFTAQGIRALRNTVRASWDTMLVAPDREQSAASHSLTLNRPLRVNIIDATTMAVDGTPTDCVMLAVMGILDKPPDLVVSGINMGANLGDDVIYSGTVAAAAEARVLGFPSIAVSFVDPVATDLDEGAKIIPAIIDSVFAHGLPDGIFLNVNIPPGKFKGIEITTLGKRSYRDVIVKKTDPRGKPYYWIGGHVEAWQGSDNCDFAAIDRGNVSITPLHLDMTATSHIDTIKNWDFSGGIR